MYEFRKNVDLQAAAVLLTACGFYGEVLPGELTGTHMYGMVDKSGTLLACVMIIRSGAQAYLDYLAVRPDHRRSGMATVLVDSVVHDLTRHKVRVIHACVSGENAASTKLLAKYRAKVGWPYISGTVRLEE